MTKIDFLNALTHYAKNYAPQAAESVIRNSHMNDLDKIKSKAPSQAQIDALLVDFINYIGACQCVDYGIYASDLRDAREVVDANEFFEK